MTAFFAAGSLRRDRGQVLMRLPRRSTLDRLGTVLIAAVLAIPWSMASPPEVLAAPNYQHPFFCGRDFQGRSYGGHGWGLDTFSGDYPSQAATLDQEVMATAGGTVSVEDPGNGHVNVLHGGGFESVYAHMDPVVVTHGQVVVAGQLLGYADEKGDATAPHLHYGQDAGSPQQDQKVRFNGVAYNYQENVDAWGPDTESTHCPTPPATDVWIVSEVSVTRRGHIDWLYDEGITSGCGAWYDNSPPETRARFCPSGVVTREQMATFLTNYMSLPPTGTDYFTDDENSSHEWAINRIRAANITAGCTATTFCPTGQVTRAQMATFLSKALGLPNTPNDYFTDDENTGSHEQRINNIRAAGITDGCDPPYLFCPSGLVTRGQMATFLHEGEHLR